MSSSDRITSSDRERLLALAWESIEFGLTRGKPLLVDTDSYPDSLRNNLACFVTLHKNGDLRGCIGHLEAKQPLVQDVADNAFAAAFNDPRFQRLKEYELQGLELHISILSPTEPIEFSSEHDLINQIRPGVDGLILEIGAKRGTFLPSVWESLPDTPSFLRHLKLKAGLDPGFWSNELKVYRYTTDSFSDSDINEESKA